METQSDPSNPSNLEILAAFEKMRADIIASNEQAKTKESERIAEFERLRADTIASNEQTKAKESERIAEHKARQRSHTMIIVVALGITAIIISIIVMGIGVVLPAAVKYWATLPPPG